MLSHLHIVNFDDQLTLEEIQQLGTHEQEAFIDKVFSSDYRLRQLVYTAFDGDDMHYLNWMCYVAHSLDYVPINPEAALGYYLVTQSRNGSKIEIMRDCISLELACDELWIFSQPSTIESAKLPEGVIAELMIWKRTHPNDNIRFLPWLDYNNLNLYRAQLKDEHSSKLDIKKTLVSLTDQERIVGEIDASFVQDLEQRLLQIIDSKGQRPRVFISQDFRDLKHVDWARALVYQQDRVPMSPDTLLNDFVSTLVHDSDKKVQHIIDRMSIMAKSDELWVFLKPSMLDKSKLQHLPPMVFYDLYCWSMINSHKPVYIYTWSEAGVPKFVPDSQWALTRKEHVENMTGIV